MESVQKYLKIIGRFLKACENFARGCEIHFPQFRKKAWENFARGCEIHSHFRKACEILQDCEIPSSQPRSLSCTLYSSWAFRKFAKFSQRGCEIVECQIPSLILFLAYLIDLAKASKLSKTWILHVIQLQLALSWTTQSSPSFLACFNDKKAIKNTKTCQKLISENCKGP